MQVHKDRVASSREGAAAAPGSAASAGAGPGPIGRHASTAGVELANMAAADDLCLGGEGSPSPSLMGTSPMAKDYSRMSRYSATSTAVGTIVEESAMPMMSRLEEYMEERIQELGRMADALARKVGGWLPSAAAPAAALWELPYIQVCPCRHLRRTRSASTCGR
jgi:hypothetical protein